MTERFYIGWRIENTTNLYVTIDEELIATLIAPCPIGDMRLRLWLPIWFSGFSVVPDEDDVIHFATLPGFCTRNYRHCAI